MKSVYCASSPFTPSPESFAKGRAASVQGGDPVENRRPEKTKVAEKPEKKKRADMLSEVANETSRKSDKKATNKKSAKGKSAKGKKKKTRADREDDRVPWWKGGMWRNRDK